MTATYQKMLVLTAPDYTQRYWLWKELITKKGGKIGGWSDRFDLSSLTKVSDGFSAGHINYAIEQVLTEPRVIQQRKKPLQPVEFVPFLAKCTPIFNQEGEAFFQWYAKTPTGKKRTRTMDGDDDESGTKKEKKSAKKKK